MKKIIITIIAAMAATGAAAGELVTVEGGVVCQRPWKLSEAIVASNRGDAAWVRELGCITLAGGQKAIKIDPLAPPADPWQVRLYGTNGAVTVWGYAPSFADPNRRKTSRKFQSE